MAVAIPVGGSNHAYWIEILNPQDIDYHVITLDNIIGSDAFSITNGKKYNFQNLELGQTINLKTDLILKNSGQVTLNYGIDYLFVNDTISIENQYKNDFNNLQKIEIINYLIEFYNPNNIDYNQIVIKIVLAIIIKTKKVKIVKIMM